MADDFAAAARRFEKLAAGVKDLPRATAAKLGRMGRTEVLQVESRLFGSDRRFSGAAHSRKARRPASASFKADTSGETVTIFPTGDPIYIRIKGRRGGATIRPVGVRGVSKRRRAAGQGPSGRASAVRVPGSDTGFRATSRVGRLAPQPRALDPAEREIRRQAPVIVDRELVAVMGRVF